MDSTPSVRTVKLLSPFNGEVIQFPLIAGTVPTLETMLEAKYVLVDDPPQSQAKQTRSPKVQETKHGTSETAQQERESGRD